MRAILAALLLAVVLVVPASAAKPEKATGEVVYTVVVDHNGDGLPNHGDTLHWTYSTTGEYPWVQVTCYQTSLVYSAFFGPTVSGAEYTPLSSPSWTSGAADCTAELSYKDGKKTRYTYLAFAVGP